MSSEEGYELNNPQWLYVTYTSAVLVDLTVLNLFVEYWDFVIIENFTVSLATAVILQVLLKLSIKAEFRLANYFKKKPGLAPKIYRGLTSYAILVGSKFVMLEAIDFALGDRVEFTGPVNGVVAFFAVILTIVLVEMITRKIYYWLGSRAAAA